LPGVLDREHGRFANPMGNAMTNTTHSLASALAAGHKSPPAILAGLPVPADYAAAMKVQAEVAGTLKARVAGWKVAIRPDGVAVAAPLFDHLVSTARTFPVAPSGLMGIEVEIGLRLARDLPPRPGALYTRADIVAASDQIFIGIEIVSTRLTDHGNAPFPLVLADNMANGAYIIGDVLTTWDRFDLGNLMTRLSFNGIEVHARRGGHGNGDPLTPVIAYANQPLDHLGGFRAGQIVTTGTLCGLVPVKADALVEAGIEDIGKASVKLQPRA